MEDELVDLGDFVAREFKGKKIRAHVLLLRPKIVCGH